MNRNLRLALILGLGLLPAPARGADVFVGPWVGVSSSTTVASEGPDADPLRSAGFGAVLLSDPSPPIGVRAEAGFVRRGAVFRDSSPRTEFRFDYLQVATLGRLLLPVGDRSPIRPYLTAGPSAAIAVNCRVEFSSAGGRSSLSCDDQLRTLDLGFVVGLGIELRGEWDRWLLEARLYEGLLDAFDADSNDIDLHNRTLSLSLTYAFRVGTLP